MATFYPITKEEMSSLVEPWGFSLISLPNTRELVWAKTRPDGVQMRVYSGINPTGESREKGSDAIRVELYWTLGENELVRIGGSKRVHRVKGWRDNLKQRMTAWKELLGPPCPKCSAPTVERTVKKEGPNQGKKFWSCCTWAKTKCNGTIW